MLMIEKDVVDHFSVIKEVRERIHRNSEKSGHKPNKEMDVSDWFMGRVIKEHLAVNPYKKSKSHGLTDASKIKRNVWCWVPGNIHIFFSPIKKYLLFNRCSPTKITD